MDIMESFKKHIMTKFDGCVVKDEHKDYVHFHVTNPGNYTIQIKSDQTERLLHKPYVNEVTLTEYNLY